LLKIDVKLDSNIEIGDEEYISYFPKDELFEDKEDYLTILNNFK